LIGIIPINPHQYSSTKQGLTEKRNDHRRHVFFWSEHGHDGMERWYVKLNYPENFVRKSERKYNRRALLDWTKQCQSTVRDRVCKESSSDTILLAVHGISIQPPELADGAVAANPSSNAVRLVAGLVRKVSCSSPTSDHTSDAEPACQSRLPSARPSRFP
jgi:hypothetical protein